MARQSAPGVHEAVLSLLSCCESGVLLDLGCGEGELTRQIASLGRFQVTAIDRRTDPDIPGVRFHKCDVEAGWDLPEAFDVVVCTELVEHLRNPWTFVERIAAALRPGGTLILSTPNIEGTASRLLFLRRGRLLNFSDTDLRESGHVHPLGYWQLKHILSLNGMQIEDVRTTPYTPVVRTVRDQLFLFLCAIAAKALRPTLPGNVLVLRARKELPASEAA